MNKVWLITTSAPLRIAQQPCCPIIVVLDILWCDATRPALPPRDCHDKTRHTDTCDFTGESLCSEQMTMEAERERRAW